MSLRNFKDEISDILDMLESSPEFRDELEKLSENLDASSSEEIEWTQPYVNATPIQEDRI